MDGWVLQGTYLLGSAHSSRAGGHVRWKCFGRLNRHNLELTWDTPFLRGACGTHRSTTPAAHSRRTSAAQRSE